MNFWPNALAKKEGSEQNSHGLVTVYTRYSIFLKFFTAFIVDSSGNMLQMRYFCISVPLIAGSLGPLTGTRVIIGTAAARAALLIYISVCSI